ncbi:MULTISPECIES: hypothetical protein [unclassified Saccharicrinis]|uniref:hypothetical protein n=1 Tax=unclassified Saccharicrinis TaxID=2646859 RepID=UPI003D33EF96
MKSNILFPFNLENSNLESQGIVVELAKNLNVDLRLLVIFQNNDFLYNEYLKRPNSKDESAKALFNNLKKKYPDIILGNEKQIGFKKGTVIDITFENFAEQPMLNRLNEDYLWVFDFHDFISNIIPTGFINQLNKHNRKVWVVTKNRSGILTQTKQIVDQYNEDNSTFDQMYWDALPLDLL